MWVPVICDICSFILQWCRSSNRGKLWFSCGCALARNAQPQLQNAHLPAQSVCCQMGAVTKNVLQPVCELLLHVLLLVSNREGQSFNIQRAKVKTSVRNKVSTVGTIYNFHTIFFLSSSIHGEWCCPQTLVLVLAHVLAKKHSAVLMLLRLCTLSLTTPHHNCASVAPVVQKIQYEKYRLQLQWTALIVCNSQFQFSPQQLKQEPTDWLGYIFLTQPGRQGVWSCHHHHYLPPLTHNFSIQLMHSIMHIKHCAVGIWRTAGEQVCID